MVERGEVSELGFCGGYYDGGGDELSCALRERLVVEE